MFTDDQVSAAINTWYRGFNQSFDNDLMDDMRAALQAPTTEAALRIWHHLRPEEPIEHAGEGAEARMEEAIFAALDKREEESPHLVVTPGGLLSIEGIPDNGSIEVSADLLRELLLQMNFQRNTITELQNKLITSAADKRRADLDKRRAERVASTLLGQPQHG